MSLVLGSQIVNPDLILGSGPPVGEVNQTSVLPSTVLVLDYKSDLVSESKSPVCEICQSGFAPPAVLGYRAPVYNLCKKEYCNRARI